MLWRHGAGAIRALDGPEVPGRPVPVEELPEDVQRIRDAVAGIYCHPGGPELTEEIAAAVRGASAPGMTPDAGARRFPYRREPYGRARIPTDLGELVVDGKVVRTENGPLLQLWRQYGAGQILYAYIPATWVRPIHRDESAWIDVYDITEE